MQPSKNRFLTLLRSWKGHPAIIAHRGDSFHSPENTLEAARAAWNAGADAWELDVRLTRDGVPVVMHDDSLLRTTDVAERFEGDPRGAGGYRVSDFDFNEIRTLDAGSWFLAPHGGHRSARAFETLNQLAPDSVTLYRSGQVIIPTLTEALLLTNELDWLVNVEIKSLPERPARLVERVLEVIDQTATAPRVLVSSFDHADVVAANKPGREHALGILTMTPLYRTHDYAAHLVGADTVHVSDEVIGSQSMAYRQQPGNQSLRNELTNELKHHGIPILVYTVNAHGPGSLAEHLAELEVAGLFTDNPGGIRRSFDRNDTRDHGGPR